MLGFRLRHVQSAGNDFSVEPVQVRENNGKIEALVPKPKRSSWTVSHVMIETMVEWGKEKSMLILVIAGILGLVGFIIYYKITLRSLEKKLDKLEQDILLDLELQNPEGSRLTRLIHQISD